MGKITFASMYTNTHTHTHIFICIYIYDNVEEWSRRRWLRAVWWSIRISYGFDLRTRFDLSTVRGVDGLKYNANARPLRRPSHPSAGACNGPKGEQTDGRPTGRPGVTSSVFNGVRRRRHHSPKVHAPVTGERADIKSLGTAARECVHSNTVHNTQWNTIAVVVWPTVAKQQQSAVVAAQEV